MRSGCFSRSYLAIERIPNRWVNTLQFLLWLRRPYSFLLPQLGPVSHWHGLMKAPFHLTHSHTPWKAVVTKKHTAESQRFSSFFLCCDSWRAMGWVSGCPLQIQHLTLKPDGFKGIYFCFASTYANASFHMHGRPGLCNASLVLCWKVRSNSKNLWCQTGRVAWDQICTPLNLTSLAHVCYPFMFATTLWNNLLKSSNGPTQSKEWVSVGGLQSSNHFESCLNASVEWLQFLAAPIAIVERGRQIQDWLWTFQPPSLRKTAL